MTSDLNLSLLEICAVIGLAQTVAVLVYIVSRAGHIRHIVIPFLTFFILSACFLADFALRRYSDAQFFDMAQSVFWLTVPAVSALLIRQTICLGDLPTRRNWLVLLFPVILGIAGYAIGNIFNQTAHSLQIAAILCGGFSLTSLWLGHKKFSLLDDEKEAKGERYWLIISTIIINMGLMGVYLMALSGMTSDDLFFLARDVLGVGLVYLSSTSLFRIYPPAIRLAKVDVDFSSEDKQLIETIQKLLDVDKVYQEAQFSRAHLARELNQSEARVSKLVNSHFGKSLPQLINEYRVKDSLQLLAQTQAAISIVAEEVGFNSLPTFNRVFKDIMGESPSDYRQRKKSA